MKEGSLLDFSWAISPTANDYWLTLTRGSEVLYDGLTGGRKEAEGLVIKIISRG